MTVTKPALLPVYLNIYDVTKLESVKVLNALLAHCWAPVKVGGIFHVAVEIEGLEWSYGKTFTASRSGVFGLPPGEDRSHNFRERILLGDTKLNMDSINAVLRDIADEYPGQGYDVLRRNCCHFAQDFCQRLGVDAPPEYISRFARAGASMEDFVKENLGLEIAEMVPSSLASRRPEGDEVSRSKKPGKKRQRASGKRFPIPGSLPVDKTMPYQPL